MERTEIKHGILDAIKDIAHQDDNSPRPRKARISKAVERTISTGPYENIKIQTNLEIEVEWESASELMTKAKKFNDMVIQDYQDTEQQVMEELKMIEKKAFPNETVKNKVLNNVKSLKDDFDTLG